MTVWPIEVAVEGTDVVLRAPDAIDAAAIAGAINASLPHLARFLDWATEPATVDAQAVRQAIAREAFDAGGDAMYTVFEGDEVVGAVGLHRRLGPGALEIGYWLRADAEGRGIMTAAVRCAARLGFDVDGAQRVVIHCHPDNSRSAAVARRAGFTLIGVDERPRMMWELRRDDAPTIA
jgi:RimJ/RimL family protein N-acetyltransferase